MAKRTPMISREYLCKNCGTIQFIPRDKGKQNELWHAKDLFCYKCKSVQHHLEAPLQRVEKHGAMYQAGNPYRDLTI